ncbi:hypothetical protein CsatB_014929 [Cannabis sativa]
MFSTRMGTMDLYAELAISEPNLPSKFLLINSSKCRSPIHWDEAGERRYLGPELVQRTSEAIEKIRSCMLASQSRQKSYADPKRRDIKFQVGDSVFLRISPIKGVRRFGKKGKLSPRYIGPFEILERIGQVAYRLALPPALSGVHNVFHISMLRKYVSDLTHVLSYDDIELQTELSYDEQPIQIIDRKEKVLRNKTIPLVKVLWRNSKVEEATWELESQMQELYPELFSIGPEIIDRSLSRSANIPDSKLEVRKV